METTADRLHPDSIRNRVSESYSRALLSAPEEMPSFGCGDPLLFSNVEPGSVVLDLGSGAGFDLIAAAARVGPEGRVIGIDMNDDMIAAARRNAAMAGFHNVEVRKGLIEDLPVESESVDWVISNCVINLSPEKAKVFAEIARVLKPGGHFSISDVCAEDLPQSVLEDETAYDDCIAGAISETDFLLGLKRAGLTDLMILSSVEYPLADASGASCGDGGCSCGSGFEPEQLAGKVTSDRFTGRKPL